MKTVFNSLSSAAPPQVASALSHFGTGTAWMDFPSAARSAAGGANYSDAGLNLDVQWQAVPVTGNSGKKKKPAKKSAATFMFPKHHKEHCALRSAADGSKFALQRGALIFQKKQSEAERSAEKPYALSLQLSAYAMTHRDGLPTSISAACDEFIMLTLARGGVETGGVLIRCGAGRQTIRVFSSADGLDILSLEAHPAGLTGAARLHGNLHVEHAARRADVRKRVYALPRYCVAALFSFSNNSRLPTYYHLSPPFLLPQVTLLARPVWLPRAIVGENARNVFTCAADALHSQAKLRSKIEAALRALRVIHAPGGAAASAAPSVANLIQTDISANRRARASTLLADLEGELAFVDSSAGPRGEFDVLANVEAYDRTLRKVETLANELGAVIHRRTVSNIAKINALRAQLSKAVACARNKGAGSKAKTKKLHHSDLLAVVPHSVEAGTTHAQQMEECAQQVEELVGSLDAALLAAPAWAPPFAALARTTRPGRTMITAMNRAHAVRVRREYPPPKKKPVKRPGKKYKSCGCRRRRAAWRKSKKTSKKKAPKLCGSCRSTTKRKGPTKKKKCTAKKKSGSKRSASGGSGGGGSRSASGGGGGGARAPPVAPAFAAEPASAAADAASSNTSLFADVFDDDAELAAIAASLGRRHASASADATSASAASAFTAMVVDAAGAECVEVDDDAAEEQDDDEIIITEQLLEAVELKVVTTTPLNLAAEWHAGNGAGATKGFILPLGGVVVSSNGTLAPFALMPLTDSLTLCEQASDVPTCEALLASLATAKSAVPLIRVVSNRAEAVHGVGMQIAALSIPRAAKRACDNADDAMRKRSLALLLGALFGVDGAATVGLSAAPIDFVATESCVACLDAPPQMRARPCGHASCCRRCWGEAKAAGLASRCFLCRAVVSSTEEVI